MGKINVGRVIIGGVVAAIVLFVIDFIVNGVVLTGQWDAAMTALGLPGMSESAGTMIVFALCNLATGIAAVWVYAGIRPRFGAGATTAIYAGLATWVIGYLVPLGAIMAMGLLPAVLLWTGIIIGVIQVPLATVAGAYLYQEE